MFNSVAPELDRQASNRRRDLSRRIAAQGRTGMGAVNTDFGNLEALETMRRSELLGQLSATAAGDDINDVFRRGDHLQEERGFQTGLDRQANADQLQQALLLQQLGLSFDPTQSGNLTNVLTGGGNAAAQSANATSGGVAQLGQLAATLAAQAAK